MVTAKKPGAGRGVGGGRPLREDKKALMIELPTQTIDLLKGHAAASAVPLWRVVDDLVQTALGGHVPPEPPPKLPPLALEVAQEAAAFLDHHEDRRVASRALRKAWAQAMLLASHDLKRRGSSEAPEPQDPLLT